MTWKRRHIDKLDDEMRKAGTNGHVPAATPEEEQAMNELRRDVLNAKSALRLAQLQSYKAALDKHRGSDASSNTREPGQHRRSKRRLLLLTAAVAAVILAIILFFPFEPNTLQIPEIQNQYLAENFDLFIQHDQVKSPSTDIPDDANRQAYNMFVLHDFDEAVVRLNEQWTTHNDTLSLYYLILSYSALGDDAQARMLFENNQQSFSAEQLDLLQRLF